MNRQRGIFFALGSVLLVSAAQLGMRWSMTRLPALEHWSTAPLSMTALAVVIAAIGAYGLSMLCWLLALRDVPLGRAYSLLSLSYALVYLLAGSLPWFHESLNLSKSLGVALVMLGVLVINLRTVPVAVSHPRSDP